MAKYRYKLAGGSRIQSRNSGHLFWPRDRLDHAGFAVREPGLRGAFFIEEFQGLSSGRQSFEDGGPDCWGPSSVAARSGVDRRELDFLDELRDDRLRLPIVAFDAGVTP